MSTLKVNKLRDTAGSADAITLDPNGGAVLAGVTTVSTVKVGSGVTISSDGDIFHTGVCTATSFSGEIPAASIVGVCTSGLTKTGGFGKVVQYKYVQSSTLVETSSSSYQNLSATFSVAITPTSSSNLLVARFDFQGCVYNNSGNDANARIGLTDDGASSYLYEHDVRFYDYGGSGGFINLPLSIEHVKVAGNTNARTYSIRYKLLAGSKVVINNYSGSSGTHNSILSVMEIEP